VTRAPAGLGSGDEPLARRRFDSKRLYAAIVFVPLFYVLVRYLPPQAFFGLIFVSGLIVAGEFYRLYFRDRDRVAASAVGIAGTGALLISLQWPEIVPERIVLLATVMAALASRLSTGRISESLTDAAVIVLGVLYAGFMLGHLLLTRGLPHGEFLIFFVVLVTWAGDTGAYYAGLLFGRTQLAPTVSPNKTVEGLVGGLFLATLAAALGRAWFLPAFNLADVVICGVLLTLVGVVGDLSESAMKRSAGVKDSGGLIPAHGGMLDRLDSMLFTAPTFYYYVTLVKG